MVLASKRLEALHKYFKENGSPYDCQLEKHHMTAQLNVFYLFFCAFKDHRSQEVD